MFLERLLQNVGGFVDAQYINQALDTSLRHSILKFFIPVNITVTS